MQSMLCGWIEGRAREEAVAEFAIAHDKLESSPFNSVYNTIEIHRCNGIHTAQDIIKADLKQLLGGIEEVIVLPEWENDASASMIVAVAQAIGKPVITLEAKLKSMEAK